MNSSSIGKYGEIKDSVIMKDRLTGRPRGFGFITYGDPAVVDTVIAETHIINDKQVEIDKGSSESKDFKKKKILDCGIPSSVTKDEPDMDLQELERELRVIEEEYERNRIMWTPWGIVDEPLLDPQEFASVMRDIESLEECERTACLSEYYDSEDEEKGYTRETCPCDDFWWEDEVYSE